MNGDLIGELKNGDNSIEIEGLWGISFAPSSSGISGNRLYFSAGPNDENDGLFGYIER